MHEVDTNSASPRLTVVAPLVAVNHQQSNQFGEDQEMDRQAVAVAASETAVHINAKVRERLLKLARKQGATSHGDAIQLVDAWIAEIAVLIDPDSAYCVHAASALLLAA
jgi:hypothetical protein